MNMSMFPFIIFPSNIPGGMLQYVNCLLLPSLSLIVLFFYV